MSYSSSDMEKIYKRLLTMQSNISTLSFRGEFMHDVIGMMNFKKNINFDELMEHLTDMGFVKLYDVFAISKNQCFVHIDKNKISTHLRREKIKRLATIDDDIPKKCTDFLLNYQDNMYYYIFEADIINTGVIDKFNLRIFLEKLTELDFICFKDNGRNEVTINKSVIKAYVRRDKIKKIIC